MITPEPSGIARRFGVWYFRRRTRSRLAAVHARGLEHLADWNRSGGRSRVDHPLIIVANHASWWDALMPILISLDYLNHDAYGIMEERQLARFRFFRKLGMFSIDRENPRSALETMNYAADLLRGSDRVLWYFPQGKIVPSDRRPLEIAGGVGRISVDVGRMTILPIAFRYELLDNERPDAWIRVGDPIEYDGTGRSPDITSREIDDLVKVRLTEVVDIVRDEVINRRFEGYQTILRGKGSVDEWWSRVRGNRSLHRGPRRFS